MNSYDVFISNDDDITVFLGKVILNDNENSTARKEIDKLLRKNNPETSSFRFLTLDNDIISLKQESRLKLNGIAHSNQIKIKLS